MTAFRPRRTVLYMPSSNERALEKAKGLAVDALILDLEDAVAPDAKAEARDRVCAAATSGEYGAKEVTIRVNGLDTEWHAADIAAADADRSAVWLIGAADNLDQRGFSGSVFPDQGVNLTRSHLEIDARQGTHTRK